MDLKSRLCTVNQLSQRAIRKNQSTVQSLLPGCARNAALKGKVFILTPLLSTANGLLLTVRRRLAITIMSEYWITSRLHCSSAFMRLAMRLSERRRLNLSILQLQISTIYLFQRVPPRLANERRLRPNQTAMALGVQSEPSQRRIHSSKLSCMLARVIPSGILNLR